MADLEVRDLTVEYRGGGYVVRALDALSMQASEGQLVLLLGPSGCGKTTLLSCLAAILTPTSGEISVFGKAVEKLQGDELSAYRRSGVGIVFQAFNLIPSLSALENVAAPLLVAGTSHRDAKRRAADLLDEVELGDRAHHRPGDLSGGQQQRVAIARALAHDPPLLLADEPTAHLDYIQVEKVLEILRLLAGPGRMVVVSTHDPRIVPIADRVVDLAPSLATASRPPERFLLGPGEVLFEQGSRGELIYVVEMGEIEIVRVLEDAGEQLLTVMRARQHFGELGPLLGIPRTATARARGAAAVTGFTVRDFRERATEDPRLAKLFASLGDDLETRHLMSERVEPPIAGNEIDTLLGSLERQRATLAWKCGGLDAAGMQATVGASTITLGGLLKHLAHVEDDYFSVRLHGRDPSPPWDSADWDADPEWDWHPAAEDTPEQLMALWRDAVARSRNLVAEALAEGGLDQRARYKKWREPPSMRRILIDLIEEYARHTGHADLIRESVDGLVGEDPPG